MLSAKMKPKLDVTSVRRLDILDSLPGCTCIGSTIGVKFAFT